MCLWLCTASVHNTKQNSSDKLPSYLQTNIIAQMSVRGEGAPLYRKWLSQIRCHLQCNLGHDLDLHTHRNRQLYLDHWSKEGKPSRPIGVRKHASPLRELTCHIMRSHCVTCHPPKVAFLPLLQTIKANTRFNDPGGTQIWVDLVGWLHTKAAHLSEDGLPSQYYPDSTYCRVKSKVVGGLTCLESDKHREKSSLVTEELTVTDAR